MDEILDNDNEINVFIDKVLLKCRIFVDFYKYRCTN